MPTTDHNINSASEESLSKTNTVEDIEATEENVQSHPKKKQVSALQAAACSRSAVEHVHPHSLSNLTSRFSHTGTNPSYGDL